MSGNAAGVWTPSYISILRQTELIPRKRKRGAGMDGFEWVGGRFGGPCLSVLHVHAIALPGLIDAPFGTFAESYC